MTVDHFIFNQFSLLTRKKAGLQNHHAVCVSVRACTFQFFNQLTDFHEIWYESYAIGRHPKCTYKFCMYLQLQAEKILTRIVFDPAQESKTLALS
jgi:hypothetical protein